MYTTAEDNAIISGQRAEQAAADLGFEVVTRTITTTNDIAQAAESLAKKWTQSMYRMIMLSRVEWRPWWTRPILGIRFSQQLTRW